MVGSIHMRGAGAALGVFIPGLRNGQSVEKTDQDGVAVGQLVPESGCLPTRFFVVVDPIGLYDHATVKRVKPPLRVQQPLLRAQTISHTGVAHEEGAGVSSGYCHCPKRWAERAGDPKRKTRTVGAHATRPSEALRLRRSQEGIVTAAKGAQKLCCRSSPPRPVRGRWAGRAPAARVLCGCMMSLPDLWGEAHRACWLG
jgi:hypothetical protein